MPASAELGHDGFQVIVPTDGVEAALGGQLLALLGHDAGGVRLVAQGDFHHLLGRRHLEIERHVEHRHQALDVVVDDVAAVLAEMGRNPVGPGLGGQQRRTHGVRMGDAAGIPYRCHVIDIHAQSEVPAHRNSLPVKPARARPN